MISKYSKIQFYSYSGKYTTILPTVPTSYFCRYGSDAISSPSGVNKSTAVFVNGSDATPSNEFPNTWDCYHSFSAHKLLVGNGHRGIYPFKGAIYSLRFYNRALTLAEIAANSSIDQQRWL